MSEKRETRRKSYCFSRQVGAKASRKLKARNSTQGVWFGLGMMGLVGWSVTVPTLLGVAFGIWLDNTIPEAFLDADAAGQLGSPSAVSMRGIG